MAAPGDDDDDDELFRDAMRGVRPMTDRPKPRTSKRAAVRRRRATPPPPPLQVEREQGFVAGRRASVSHSQLAALRRGEHAVDARIDLHGHRGDDARAALIDRVARARAAGARCVLVIHGRGAHSAGGPVLPELVADALASGAVRGVTAFCTALPRDGGSGAMYVLLARK